MVTPLSQSTTEAIQSPPALVPVKLPSITPILMSAGVCKLFAQKLSSQSEAFHTSSNEPAIYKSGIHPVLEAKKSGSKSMSVDVVVVAGIEDDDVGADKGMGTEEGHDENIS
jgi:hypothetical protein